MGCCFSCIQNNEEYCHQPLITNRYCHQCKTPFISNNEYNKHIINCNKVYGDY